MGVAAGDLWIASWHPAGRPLMFYLSRLDPLDRPAAGAWDFDVYPPGNVFSGTALSPLGVKARWRGIGWLDNKLERLFVVLLFTAYPFWMQRINKGVGRTGSLYGLGAPGTALCKLVASELLRKYTKAGRYHGSCQIVGR